MTIKTYITQLFWKANTNRPIDAGVRELFTACCHGDVDKVSELIDAGIDLHTEDEAALRLAAWWGQSEVVAFLLTQGADPQVRNGEACRWANERGHDEVAAIIDRNISSLKQNTGQRPRHSPEQGSSPQR